MAEGNNNAALPTNSLTEADRDRICEETDIMDPEMSACDDALQRFLQQQRSDLMYELRRIQYGERPVTGQNHREHIANFVAKHVPEPEGASGKNIPANVDAVEEHRPEAVVVEVQGVVEQRRVSSMLQSQSFRRHLESIIRGSISSATHNVASAAASRTRTSSSPPSATPDLSAPARTPPPAHHMSTSSFDSVDRPAAQPTTRDASLQPNHPSQVQGTAQRNAGEEEPSTDRGLWDSISQAHHEEMVYEISDLLHRRLVSSALGSEFRTVMELHVQEHLSQTRTDGEAVANFIRNIPQSQVHVPNDFRHLGIAPGPREDISDNISITGVSATTIPYTQTNLHLSRELRSLKSQMEEMKNMLKLSFDLQMDIQRAIRQEVAAAIASATGQGAAAAAAAERHSTPINDSHCLICLENHSDSVLYQCGHICVCFTCGKNLMSRGNGKCPVCRAPIKDIIRAFKSNVE